MKTSIHISSRKTKLFVAIAVIGVGIFAYLSIVLRNSFLKQDSQHKRVNAINNPMASYSIKVGTSPGSTTNSQVPELFKVNYLNHVVLSILYTCLVYTKL